MKTVHMLTCRRPLSSRSRKSWQTYTCCLPMKIAIWKKKKKLRMEIQGIKWQKSFLFIKTFQVTTINGGLSLFIISEFGLSYQSPNFHGDSVTGCKYNRLCRCVAVHAVYLSNSLQYHHTHAVLHKVMFGNCSHTHFFASLSKKPDEFSYWIIHLLLVSSHGNSLVLDSNPPPHTLKQSHYKKKCIPTPALYFCMAAEPSHRNKLVWVVGFFCLLGSCR